MKKFRTPVLASLITCSLLGMSTFTYANTSMNYSMEMAAKKDNKKDQDNKKSTKKSKKNKKRPLHRGVFVIQLFGL